MPWLKAAGFIPAHIDSVWRVPPRTSLDPNAIPAGYLAAVAFEWDSWGPSRPHEFLDAVEFELEGTEKKDVLSELLASLGREKSEED